MKFLPALEDIDDESVFMISCIENKVTKEHPPLVGNIEIEGTETLALIDTGATMNVMDMSTFNKLRTPPIIKHMNAKIYPYGSTTP